MSGSSVATPPAGGRRAARASHAYTTRGRRSRLSTALLGVIVVAWFVGWVAATVVSLDAVVDVPRVPREWARYGAALVTVLLSAALARRSGGRTWFWALLNTLFVALVLRADVRWLYSSAAVLVAVVGGVVAVLLTRPAPTYLRLLWEYAVALLLAASAGVAVAAYGAPVSSARYYLLVLALTLTGSMALVWRLGAGFHGLGRRGVLLIVAGAVLVTAVVVYSRVLREYGSTSITTVVQDVIDWTRDRLNGVPRPLEVLVGFPALLWGVHTRSLRRQGWWMCAFGTFGTATVATTLAAPTVDPAFAGRSLLYSVGLGLLIGVLVLQLDAWVTRRSTASAAGRRAHREQAQPPRPEPGRVHPLR